MECLGTAAEVLFSQRHDVAACFVLVVACGALSYDATRLWAMRGGGLDNKAATNQAAIAARERNEARLEALKPTAPMARCRSCGTIGPLVWQNSPT